MSTKCAVPLRKQCMKYPGETKKFEKPAREIGAGNIIEKVAEAKKQKDMVLNANKKPDKKLDIRTSV